MHPKVHKNGMVIDGSMQVAASGVPYSRPRRKPQAMAGPPTAHLQGHMQSMLPAPRQHDGRVSRVPPGCRQHALTVNLAVPRRGCSLRPPNQTEHRTSADTESTNAFFGPTVLPSGTSSHH